MLLPKRLKALAPFISRDKCRPVLGAVRLEDTHAVATDSYRLVRIDYKPVGPATDYPTVGDRRPDDEPLAVNVDGAVLMKALGAVGAAHKALPILNSVATMGIQNGRLGLAVTDRDLRQQTVYMAPVIHGAYPDYAKFTEELPPARATVSLDAGFLADMAKAVKVFGSPVVTIAVSSPLKPVVFTAQVDGDKFTGVQMPVRIDPKLEAPSVAQAIELDKALAELRRCLAAEQEPASVSVQRRNRQNTNRARKALDAVLMGGDK